MAFPPEVGEAAYSESCVNTANKLQASHPGFDTSVLTYEPNLDIWTKAGSIPFAGQVTTTAVIFDHQILLPCGEIPAAVRTGKYYNGQFRQPDKKVLN